MRECNLCRISKATKRNSHIFPRFLGTSLFFNSTGNKGYIIMDYNKYIPVQDSPKEDFILCPDCEKLISDRYETYMANNFYYKIANNKCFFVVSIRNQYS